MPAYCESWRQLTYVHANLHSETCLKRLSKAQATLTCRVEVALRKVKFLWGNKFLLGNVKLPVSSQGVWRCRVLTAAFTVAPLSPRARHDPCPGRLRPGLRVTPTPVGLRTGTGMHPQNILRGAEVSVHCPTVLTQELLVGIVHQQRMLSLNKSLAMAN